MSRCFPYPPPGFEPKLRNVHADLVQKVEAKLPLKILQEEKHKDKKHKKEKKDKDKREGKEKREKDKHHSKEKHRDNDKDKEKKERKEKHKHKKKEKESDRDKHRAQSVLLPMSAERTPEQSRILNEHSRRVDEGSQAGPGSQFMERKFAGTSTYGSSEKRPVPVPASQSVPSVHRKSNDPVKVGPTSQTSNHRVSVVSERRVAGMPSSSSLEEGLIVKKTVSSASNPNITNSNSLVQRKNNGPSNQVVNHHGTGFTERRVVGAEAKKPVPSPLNSLQGKSNGPSSQSTNHHQVPVSGSLQNKATAAEKGDEAKRVAGNSMVQMQRKTDRSTLQVTNNLLAAGLSDRRVGLNQSMGLTSTLEKEKDRDKSGLNLRGSEPGSVKQEEGKKEKRKERDEKKKEKEQRRLEKKQRKEREKEEREKKKEKEREKVKEVGNSMVRPSIEGLQRNIEKVGATDGFLSKKRKEGESNGFLHEDDMRARKLVRTSPLDTLKRKDSSTNGFAHENDAGSNKLTIKLPPYTPPLENGRTSNHQSPSLPPPIQPSISSPSTIAINNTPANVNNTIKAEVSAIKKAPQLNGTIPDAKVPKKRKEDPPHPDLKYLSVVYSVPKLEEKELLPPFDDQEWLFGTKPNHNPNLNPKSEMPESGLSQGLGQVWDRAVMLDSTDAFALPYVVPF